MILGRIAGEITATIGHPFYGARRLLIVEKTGTDGKATGDYLVAVDSVGAGVGDPVLVLDEGTGARQVLASTDGPVRSVVVGILDRVDEET